LRAEQRRPRCAEEPRDEPPATAARPVADDGALIEVQGTGMRHAPRLP
jgi:hypothetical protein